jgi:hypothetical protein
MGFIITSIKLIIISILAVFYYPLNTAFLYFQKHYRAWEKEDRVSFILATPLYYLLFLVTSVLGLPLEMMGEAFHPGLGGFR